MNSKLEQDDGGKAHGKNKSDRDRSGKYIAREMDMHARSERENPLYSIAVVIWSSVKVS